MYLVVSIEIWVNVHPPCYNTGRSGARPPAAKMLQNGRKRAPSSEVSLKVSNHLPDVDAKKDSGGLNLGPKELKKPVRPSPITTHLCTYLVAGLSDELLTTRVGYRHGHSISPHRQISGIVACS